ncbi:hypothetical protein HYC85_011544 [Camellia sinensis]|uniref:Uncharacterized protein n=1 Tax=Camellia sinensis TaxID=4442 RepID=A0A7J7HBA8_CAMSI|nr:hypothetical protein HYC85_011544 [Camellia sinensis]
MKKLYTLWTTYDSQILVLHRQLVFVSTSRVKLLVTKPYSSTYVVVLIYVSLFPIHSLSLTVCVFFLSFFLSFSSLLFCFFAQLNGMRLFVDKVLVKRINGGMEPPEEPPAVNFAFVSSVLLPDGTPDVHFRVACGGQKLRDIMLDSNIELYGPYVVEGKELLNPRTDKEKEKLKRNPKNWRLACQTTVGKPDSRGLFMLGLAAAASVRVGNELGRGHPLVAKLSVLVVIGTSILISIIFSAIVLIFKIELSKLFTSDSEVIEAVSNLTPLLAISVFLNGIQPILSARTNWDAEVVKAADRLKHSANEEALYLVDSM